MDKLKEKYLKFLRKCKVSKLDIVVEMQDYDYQKKFFGKEIDTSWW
jgi:hypothetical protein